MGNAMLGCCYPGETSISEEGHSSAAQNRVELAATQLFGVPGLAAAYHTSVLINGEEYFFSDSGIFSDRKLISHQGTPAERFELGYTSKTGYQLYGVMQRHFQPGSYDLLRKNCNSFSDAAIWYLLGKRLDSKYSTLERLGQSNVSLIEQVTKGAYTPNPDTVHFKVEDVIAALAKMTDAEKKATANYGKPRRQAFYLGVQVTVVGLKNAAHLNGQEAQIIRYNMMNGRWEAKLSNSAEVKSFRAENLRPAGETPLEPGDSVVVHSLHSKTGQELNGQEAVIVRYVHEASRYEVNLNGGVKALKAENLRLASDGD